VPEKFNGGNFLPIAWIILLEGGEMWLPRWLYRAQPFIYSVGGVLAIYCSNHVVGYASGALLILTGFLVFKLRADKTRM
jgi:hypothetical protein